MPDLQNPRPSPIAGRWYPADPEALARSVDGYLEAASLPPLAGEVIGVIAPHAGLRYSGPVAGHAFAALRNRDPELVVLLGPFHYPAPHPLLTPDHDGYLTPLGGVPIDSRAVRALDDFLQIELGLGLHRLPQDPEHSLEMELPFLQRSLTHEVPIVPLMLADQSEMVCRALARGLVRILRGRDCVLVASTDLSHYLPHEITLRHDQILIEKISAFDPVGVLQARAEGVPLACGPGAVATMLWTAKEHGAEQVQILHYATSGGATGDLQSVVGYCAAAIIRPPPQENDAPVR